MHCKPPTTPLSSKPHYPILDGLRGVAAIMVVLYHIFEAFATSPVDQVINHGYLAVDFFFLLSGFVIAYAYDDRWERMSLKEFSRRRRIRLHPMLLLGAIIGGLMFYTQGCDFWQVGAVSLGSLLAAVVMNALLIPASPSIEIRGGGEMYPLNGPTWSLFFEYIANILYALVLRRLTLPQLRLWVGTLAVGLIAFATLSTWGHIGVGWTMDGENILGGSLRLLFSFSAGMLMARSWGLLPVRRLPKAFATGAVGIALLTAMPRIGGEDTLWLNGLYDSLCAVVLFPLILYIGGQGQVSSPRLEGLCRLLGDLSYPLYLVHYPFLYLYFAWVKNNDLDFTASLPGALALLFGSIALAYLCLRYYDEPVRRWLSRKLG